MGSMGSIISGLYLYCLYSALYFGILAHDFGHCGGSSCKNKAQVPESEAPEKLAGRRGALILLLVPSSFPPSWCKWARRIL